MSRCERSSLPRRISDRRLCGTSRHRKAVRSGPGRIAWRSFELPRKLLVPTTETHKLLRLQRKPLVRTSRLVGDARCFVATVALGRCSPSSGRHAHQGFSRHLRRFDKKRVSSVSITERSNWRRGTRHKGTVLSLSEARIHGVNTLTMLADSLTKPGSPDRAVMASFEPRTDGDSPLIPVSSLGGREELLCSQTMCLRITTQLKIRWRSTSCCRIGRTMRRFVSSCVSSMKDGQAESHRVAKIEESLWPKQIVKLSSNHTPLDCATEA